MDYVTSNHLMQQLGDRKIKGQSHKVKAVKLTYFCPFLKRACHEYDTRIKCLGLYLYLSVYIAFATSNRHWLFTVEIIT